MIIFSKIIQKIDINVDCQSFGMLKNEKHYLLKQQEFNEIHINKLSLYYLRQMDEFLRKVQQISSIKQILRQCCRQNGLNPSLGEQVTVPRLKLLNDKFEKVQTILIFSHSLTQGKIKTSWIENELKAFNWILIALSALENVKIAEFVCHKIIQDQKHWIILQNIFHNKTHNFLKFEARRLLQQKKFKNRNWSEQQNELLLKIVTEVQSKEQPLIEQNIQEINENAEEHDEMGQLKKLEPNKEQGKKERVHWNEVARMLFEESDQKYFRLAKHCRERWFNYLDPSKQRGKWRDQEDLILMNMVNRIGNKWSEIANNLRRTEHSVKNRYHSLRIKSKGSFKNKTSDKPKRIKLSSLQQPQIQVCPIKQQNQKEPFITITEFPDKQRPKQTNEISFEFMEDLEDFQQLVRSDYPSKNTKNQFCLFSPFHCYSPKNLTPFIGSPSPITFSMYKIANFASSQQNFNEALINRDNAFLGERQ